MGVVQHRDSAPQISTAMDAIKKKMQAMKVEKDNACDRADVCEEASKVAKVRAEKAEDEVFENKAGDDDKRIAQLEKELKDARDKAEAADTSYDEVAKKLAACDSDLEKAEERADTGEQKILELEEELRVVANNLKSLEVAEKSVQKLQKEVDRLEDELVAEQEKYKAVTEELEQTFAEMSGY